MAHHKTTGFYLISSLVLFAVALRGLGFYFLALHPFRWLAAGLLLAFGLLMAVEPWLSRRFGSFPHVYLALQAWILFGLLLFRPPQDFFAALGLPLSAQAMRFFSQPTGFRWIGIFMVVMALGLVGAFGWLNGLPIVLLFGAGYVFVASYAYVTEQAEAARITSQRLLAELQTAHHQLQDYAAQAEQLAVMEERNRLARDLHDSVTQALYGLTLQAEATARELASGAVSREGDQLREIRRMAQQALGELRALLFELRPPDLVEEGLAAALQGRLAAVEGRAGLEAELVVDEDGPLPPEIEVGLYRIAQEALSNVLKHAQAQHVTVSVRHDHDAIVLEIADDGRGFDVPTSRTRGGLGLRSMEERARQIGGALIVWSTPGAGTRVRVEVSR